MVPVDRLLAISKMGVWVLIGILFIILIVWDRPESKVYQQTTIEPEVIPLKGSDPISLWQASIRERRIALCVNMLPVINNGETKKITTIELYNCIEEATRGVHADLTIGQVAASCAILIRNMYP